MNRKLSAAKLVGLEELTAPLPPPQDADQGGGVTRVSLGDGQLVVSLPLTSIAPNPHQPRRTFTPAALQDLATSIADYGRVLQPILVRPCSGVNDSPPFELIAGERRWRASELAGMPTIRAIVDGVDDVASAEMALTENMARDDLSPIEEARGCAALRDSFGMSVTKIALRIGRDRTAVSHLIRLLELPEQALELIGNGLLSEGHGRVLLRLPDSETQRDLSRVCANEQWSVRELERRVDVVEAEPSRRPTRPLEQPVQLHALTATLQRAWGGDVSIVPRRRGSYEIRIRCTDLDVLRGAVDRLRAGTFDRP